MSAALSTLARRGAAPALLLACAHLFGCATRTDTVGAPAAVRVLDAGLAAPAARLPPVVVRSAGIELHSCADLLAALRAGKPLGEAAELPQFNAYADCLAAALVAEGRGTDDGAFDLPHAGERIYRDLDLATVASSLAPRRPAEHYRLRELALTVVALEPLALALRSDGFAYEFKVLAVGDFSHAGRAELLVRFVDRATGGGSYDKTTVLVLAPATAAPALAATDALAVLAARPPPAAPAR